MSDQMLCWLGTMLPIMFGALGSCLGCVTAASALAGGLVRVKSGHGGLIAMSAAPSSQTIYGIVLMMSLKAKIATVGTAAALSPAAFLAIGFCCGLAIMVSAWVQGHCAAAGIRASVEDPSVYGKCWIPIGVTESFAVFAMVFGIVMLG